MLLLFNGFLPKTSQFCSQDRSAEAAIFLSNNSAVELIHLNCICEFLGVLFKFQVFWKFLLVQVTGPLLRNHDLGGNFQKGDLIFDTRNISLYELLRKACISYKA